MWCVDGGAEIGPVNFQVPIAYGAINVADNFEPDFQVPWPATRRHRRHAGRHAAGSACPTARSTTSPRRPASRSIAAIACRRTSPGDLFFTEPVGRIVRRAKVVVNDGLTQLRNAYPKSEFIRSTDPLFRPVNVSTAPDGSLLVIDMYTGIIQDAQFVGPDSYLRRKVEQYGLDKQHNWGRIWRVTHESAQPDRRQPRMYSETPAQLVKHLEHPNGWWRDTAQKLLVLRQDKSVVPALKTMARSRRTSSRASTRCGRSKGSTRSTPRSRVELMKDRRPADQDPGDSRQRNALQARAGTEGRQVVRGRLSRADEGRRRQRGHPGDADAQPAPRSIGTRARSPRRWRRARRAASRRSARSC